MRNLKKVLIVDDSDDWRNELEELFQSRNFNVLKAKNRQTALSLLSKNVFDIAVLDVNLTDEIHNVDGMFICYEFKQKSPSTRVILISARNLTARELENIQPAIFIEKSHIWEKLNSFLDMQE